MKVVICGNSHVGALRRGLLPRHARHGHDLCLYPVGKGAHERFPFSCFEHGAVSYTTESYAESLVRFTGGNRISAGVTWGFLHVNSNSRIYGDSTWKAFEPAAVAAPGKTPLSDDLVRAIIVRDQHATRELFLQLKAAAIDFFAISGPFPRSDNADFSGRIRRPVAAHVDEMARREWREWTAAQDITLIEPPPQCRTTDGFLHPAYNEPTMRDGKPDQLHANPQYGSLMLDLVVDHLVTRG